MSKKLVFLSLVTGLAACGSGSKEMTVAEFTQKISQNECANATYACLIKETDCLASRQAYWSQVANQAVAAGRPFDPSNADECLAETKSVYSVLEKNVGISAEEWRKQKTTCEHVFHGPAKENEPCTGSFDCVDDLVCDKGFCGRLVQVGAGKQCANIGEYCAPGFTCAVIGTGPVRQCVARAAKGAVCSADDTCLEELRCAGGVCTEGLRAADDCLADEDCEKGFCEPFAHQCSIDVRFAKGSPACLAFQGTAPTPLVNPDASVD